MPEEPTSGAEVFLSYSRKDQRFVSRLQKDLVARGLQVTRDEKSFRIGESVVPRIAEAIAKADHVIVVLSQASVQSPWVQEEISKALSRQVREGRKTLLLPILLEDCEIPEALADKNYADFRDPARYDERLQQLVETLGTEYRPLPAATSGGWRPPRRLTALLLVAAALAAPAGTLLWRKLLAPPPLIAVLDLPGTCDVFGEGFSAGFSEMLAAALEAGGGLPLPDRQSVFEAEQDLVLHRLLRRATDRRDHFRRRLGAGFVVSGTCGRRTGKSSAVTVQVRLENTAGGAPFVSKPRLGSSGAPLALAIHLADELRMKLGRAELTPGQQRELRALFPRSPDAIAHAFAGIARFRSSDFEGARESFDKARALEPHPWILRWLAGTLWGLEDDVGAAQAARQAEEGSGPLPRREQLRIRATRAQIDGRWRDAAAAYEELSRRDPWDLASGLSLAGAQAAGRDVDRALATLASLRARWTSPMALVQIDLQRADLLHDRGRLGEAKVPAEQAAAAAESASSPLLAVRAQLVLAEIDSSMGRHAAAKRRLDAFLPVARVQADPSLLANWRELQAIEAFQTGDGAQVQEILAEYKRANDTDGNGRILHLLSADALARGDFRTAEELSRQVLAIFPADRSETYAERVVALAERAFLFYSWGKPEESEPLVSEAFSLASELQKRDVNEPQDADANEPQNSDAMASVLEILTEVLYQRGDFADAEDKLQAILTEHCKVKNQEGAAYDELRLGLIYAWTGDREARRYLLAGVQGLEQPAYRAEARLGLARFEVLEGDPAAGLEQTDLALRELSSPSHETMAALARLERVHALLALERVGEAQRELARVGPSQAADFRVRYEAELLAARLTAASGRPQDVEKALADLEALAERARQASYTLFALEARLARGAIGLRAGGARAEEARKALRALADEARQMRYAQLAARAEQALAGGRGPVRTARHAAAPPPQC